MEHQERVRSELIAAGVTPYGLRKMVSRYLPEIIGPNEHIKAVAYGIRKGFSGMLVATDKRVIYTERKPFYKVLDEVPYEMVSGVRYNQRGQKAAVVLHTRVGDYDLGFVNRKVAEKFVKHIEAVRLNAPAS